MAINLTLRSAKGSALTFDEMDNNFLALKAAIEALQAGGGTVTPTLALTGPLTYATNAAAGTLVANIGNVPAGVTPTLTPNDGRMVVAGDATAGWKVVTGMSASSAGTITLAVAASGATGASAPVVVTAAVTNTLTYSGVALTFANDPLTYGAAA